MNSEELAIATANTVTQRDVAVQATTNGYVITGSTRYMDEETGVQRAALTQNAVATETSEVSMFVQRYLNTGRFEALN